MTLDSTTSKVQYTQAGTTTEWPVTFKFLDNEDLIVITTVDDVDTTLVLDTDYTVTGAGDDAGGTVTISPAVAAGTRVTIYRVVDLDQPTELTTAGGWFPKVHEAVFDRLTMIDQQLQEQLDRAVKLAPTTTLNPDTVAEELFEARDDAQTAASEAEASAIRAEIASSTVAYYNHEGTLLTGEDTISLPWAYDTNVGVEVYLSGVKQAENTITFVDPYTVQVGTAVSADTPYEVVASAGARGDFANLLAQTTGSALVGFTQAGTGASYRTVESKIREIVSVKDFGAVGDGVTDDTASFSAALDASAHSVYVPPGVYVLDGLTVSSKRLFGVGTIKWKSAYTGSCITLTGDWCVLEGLTFDGNKENQTLDLTMVRTVAAPNAKLLNNRITNGRYKFFQTDVGGSPGVKAHGNVAYDWGANPSTGANVFDFRSSYFSAIGNHFTRTGIGHNIRTGVYESDPQTPVRGGVIAGNVFYDCLYTGVVVELGTQGLTITGNTFDTIDQGVKMESALGTQYDIVVSGNTFRNLRIGTAFNFTATRVTFVGNTCLDCAGGIDLGLNSVCSGNTIRNCGNAALSMPSIRSSSSSGDCIISDNNVTNSPWRGIQATGHRTIVKGNRVAASSTLNIQVAGDDTIVADNITTGGTHGIVVDSAATNTTVTGNNCSGASTANYSGVTNGTALFDATNFGYAGGNVLKTIVSDAISIVRIGTVLSVVVDTEGGAASDSLSTITPSLGATVGAILLLRTVSSSRVITVKDGIGNLRLAGDFVMNSSTDRLVLVWDGGAWHEISRSDND